MDTLIGYKRRQETHRQPSYPQRSLPLVGCRSKAKCIAREVFWNARNFNCVQPPLNGTKPEGSAMRHSVYEISKSSNLPKDFWISREISRFHDRFKDFTRGFQDFTKDFGIPGEISRSHGISGISRKISGFQDFTKDLGIAAKIS